MTGWGLGDVKIRNIKRIASILERQLIRRMVPRILSSGGQTMMIQVHLTLRPASAALSDCQCGVVHDGSK